MGPDRSARARQAWMRRVDLPAPGSPPTSTSEPLTMPPPRPPAHPADPRPPAPPRLEADARQPLRPRSGLKCGPRRLARLWSLLDQGEVLALPGAIGAGTGLGRGEAAGLAAVHHALARHHFFSLLPSPRAGTDPLEHRRRG